MNDPYVPEQFAKEGLQTFYASVALGDVLRSRCAKGIFRWLKNLLGRCHRHWCFRRATMVCETWSDGWAHLCPKCCASVELDAKNAGAIIQTRKYSSEGLASDLKRISDAIAPGANLDADEIIASIEMLQGYVKSDICEPSDAFKEADRSHTAAMVECVKRKIEADVEATIYSSHNCATNLHPEIKIDGTLCFGQQGFSAQEVQKMMHDSIAIALGHKSDGPTGLSEFIPPPPQ